MRLVLAALGLGLAGAVLPATPASAICIYPYQVVTHDCSPCTTGNRVFATVEEATGDELPGGGVFLTCVA